MVPHLPLAQRLFLALRQEDRHPLADILRHTPAAAGLPVGDAAPQPRRADADPGDRRGARLPPTASTPPTRGPAAPGHPPPAGPAGGQQPAADRAALRPAVLAAAVPPSSTTATRSAWGTTSTSATATASARRCSGRPTATPASPAPTSRGSTARRSRTRLRLPGRQRRGAEARPVVAVPRRPPPDRPAQEPAGAGAGRVEILEPANRKVFACVRRHGDETVLVVANLARTTQPVELDLSAFAGLTPVELAGHAPSRPSARRPYFLSLGPHALHWFGLRRAGPRGRLPPGPGGGRGGRGPADAGGGRRLGGGPDGAGGASAGGGGAAGVPPLAALVRRQGPAGRVGPPRRLAPTCRG